MTFYYEDETFAIVWKTKKNYCYRAIFDKDGKMINRRRISSNSFLSYMEEYYNY